MKTIMVEALALAIAGTIFAFAANALSSRGLSLSRDYFQTARVESRPITNSQATAVAPGADTNTVAVVQRLASKGLSAVDADQMIDLFKDPRYQQGVIMFVDARDDAHYTAGHIPGAYQLDYYRPMKYLETVLPASGLAEQIVVYCNGGSCEDSELTALLLRDSGVRPDKLRVYPAGYAEWEKRNWPVEKGERLSGQILNAINK